MNRDQARNLVRETLTQKFDKGRFTALVGNLLNRIDTQKTFSCNNQYVKDAFKPHVNRYERIAKYTAPDQRKIDILVVHLTENANLGRTRTALRNFVADYLKNRDRKDAALVAFVSPSDSAWRFSYVKMEYATVETSSGDVATEARLTPARRFSYLVGPGESCHTAQTRFVSLLQDTTNNPTLTDIEAAFSVEAVTREFFARYKELFLAVKDELDRIAAAEKAIQGEFSQRKLSTADFAKKLLGQIVFLYFLQKKGWLGVAKDGAWGNGPHNFLRKLANREFVKYGNLFNDILEPLFYDTLATDRGHEALCKKFNCRIPFLNGGLFEPLGGYDWRNTEILLPNELFTNTQPVEEGIIGTGILDVFDRYNFTVNEAEPLEKEVAIDPEMLGKVFENLLEVKERKSKGSFYTPREIVHYMCQESLINYLDTAINGNGNGDTGIPACKLSQCDTGIPVCAGSDAGAPGIPVCAPPKVQCDTDIPVCADVDVGVPGIPACASSKAQGDTGIPACAGSGKIHKTTRNLPHWTREGSVYWTTFRLADSLPQEKLDAWRAEREIWLNQHPKPWSDEDCKEYDAIFDERLQSWLDAGYGSCALMRPDVRQVVQECLLRFDGQRLRLHAAVIMPNHIHLLLEPLVGNELSELLKGIKGASARKANQALGNTGTAFWMDESYDHIVRSERQRQHLVRYMMENPIKANLPADQFWLYQCDGDTGIPVCAPPQTQTRMSVPRCDIETLVHSGDQAAHYETARVGGTTSYRAELPPGIENNARSLDEALASITVCDPAIGSGAFPVGMMHEIVRARSALTPYFNDVAERTAYHFKRHAIQNCLYGVDIDPGAVEIAKLRLWLSLVVDEEDVQQIKPLPNLDYKVVVGNSLLGVEKTLFNQELFTRLEEIKPKYFDETNSDKKHEYRKEINQLIQDLTDGQTAFDFEIYFSEVFHRNGGFDVVIGNPPYLFARNSKEKGITAADKKIYNGTYMLAEYQINLYPLFIERGTGILRESGSFAFITPNNWLTINTNGLLRNFVLNRSEITIVNFYARMFAGADVDNSIIIYKKSAGKRRIKLFEYRSGLELVKEADCDFFLQQRDSIINIDAQKGGHVAALMQKIESRADRLRDVADARVGLKAYQTGKGRPPQEKKAKDGRIFHSGDQIDETYIKYLDGRDVSRYRLGWGGEYLKYGRHLAEPRTQFRLFSSKRILVRQIPANPPYCIHACIAEETLLNDLNSMNIINSREPAELVLGILNARLTSFWFVHRFGKMQRRTFPQFKVNELAEFPLPRGRERRQAEIIRLVGEAMSARRSDPGADICAIDREIDRIVYSLYGLTPEEIAIVEGTTEASGREKKKS